MGGAPLRIASELVRLARDRLARASTIPRTIGKVTPSWLGEVMGADVRALEVLDATDGTTSRARMHLQGDNISPTVFVKLAPAPVATRAFVDLMELGTTEVRFYREIAPASPLAVPVAHGARADPATGRFALILEDLVARGCRFGDVRRTATADEAAAVVTALARLHASFWESARFNADLSWVVSHAVDPNNAFIRPLVKAAARRVARSHGDLVPPGARELIAERNRIEQALAAGPATLLHGDPHLGNLYFDDRTPGFLDWQVLRRGHGLRDVTYFLVLSVETEIRRALQADLLRTYLDALSASGGPELGFDDTFLRYRREAGYAWIAAVVTTGLGGFQAEEIAATGLRRAAAALEDLGTVAATRDLLASRAQGG
jgi:aminoglycoside phosphotransferase (APT) family kinase protein